MAVGAIPMGMPLGSANQTIRHNGTAWIASDTLQNDGAKVSVNGDIKVTGGSPAAGKVLTATDAQGNANWQPGGGGGGGNCSMKIGTYVGDGVDDRNIDIGVNLAAKTYVYIVIKSSSADHAVHRIEYGQGDLTMRYNNATDSADLIQSLTATGFQVGSDIKVNGNTYTYRYIAFWVD